MPHNISQYLTIPWQVEGSKAVLAAAVADIT